MYSITPQITLTAGVQTRQKYNFTELVAMMAKSTNLPIYSEQTLWEGEDTITEFQLCSTSSEALDLLKRNKYLRGRAACIVGPNFAEIRGFWLGDKAGNTEILICNIPQREIRIFLESMKNVETLTLHDGEPFEKGGVLWDQWHDRAEKEEKKSESSGGILDFIKRHLSNE